MQFIFSILQVLRDDFSPTLNFRVFRKDKGREGMVIYISFKTLLK
jgi:hypothetical protein